MAPFRTVNAVPQQRRPAQEELTLLRLRGLVMHLVKRTTLLGLSDEDSLPDDLDRASSDSALQHTDQISESGRARAMSAGLGRERLGSSEWRLEYAKVTVDRLRARRCSERDNRRTKRGGGTRCQRSRRRCRRDKLGSTARVWRRACGHKG